MNKLYYVVGLVLLLLFTSIKERIKGTFTISSPNRMYFLYNMKRKNISSYKKNYIFTSKTVSSYNI